MVFRGIKKTQKEKNSFQYTDHSDIRLELTAGHIKTVLEKSKDVYFRQMHIGEDMKLPITIVHVDGLSDYSFISDYILKPLIQEEDIRKASTEKEVIQLIDHGMVYFPTLKIRTCINQCLSDIIRGSVAVVFDGSHTAITFETKGFEKRSITEPSAENVIKGSKDSFVETIRVNTATVRRKIKSHNLVVDEMIVGKQTSTPVSIIYLENITNQHIVEEVKKRICNIEVDNALTVSFVEEHIIDKKLTAFPQVLYTERPDKFCSSIVEGRVGLIIDGIPSAMIVPCTLLQLLQAPEDYSQNFITSSIVRLLRFILMVTTLFLPGFYIAVTTFHHEMIPTELALSIDASKEGVPFPSFIEVFFMLAAFEVLVEAGIRLPRSIGQAVSIVGAIVVGQAAVEAKLVSPAIVVVLAITAIASFTMPNRDLLNALTLWRLIIAICSSIIGLFGLSVGAILLLYHLCSMEVFGVPYLTPFVSNDAQQLEDTLFRFPANLFKYRPMSLRDKNMKRQK